MKDLNKLIWVAIVLILLPSFFSWVSYYPGSYDPGEIPVIDDSNLIPPQPNYIFYRDEPAEGNGIVIFDFSHLHNLFINDLTPLRDRIANRGATIVDFDDSTGFDTDMLRGASALVIASPTLNYTDFEIEAIIDFVDDGGRLLLVADPTRTAELNLTTDIFAALFPESAIPVINGLANQFGIEFVDDYLYNLAENEGNYRNVVFTDFESDLALTEGLQDVVFYAAHSIRTNGTPVVTGDRRTFSPVRTGEIGLSPVVLAENGKVLALGDLTFLTPPFHTVADNDHFMSNIADWLSTAERDWDVKDFPYLFERQVDLITLGDDPIDLDIIFQLRNLERALRPTGLSINLSGSFQIDHDTILVGTYADSDDASRYLNAAQVNFTESDDSDLIEIASMGTFNTEGTVLYITSRTNERVLVLVMAEDIASAIDSLGSLAAANFSECATSSMVTLCAPSGLTFGDSSGDGAGTGGFEPLCEGIPVTEPLAADFPRIASVEEVECVLEESFALSLESLSEEGFIDTEYEPGDIYTYTINMDESLPTYWFWGWCTTPDQFEENFENITIIFTLNGIEIPLSSFYIDEDSGDSIACRTYMTILTDWPDGYHFITTEIIFETDIDDGFDVYEAGTRTFIYDVAVGQ